MAIQNLYPNQRPSLDLNFAGSKTVDPRITFTRASSATYFDEFGGLRTASNNVPRIDHNPATGECLGLLIEEQRTNLVTYSEQFDNAVWTKTNSGGTLTYDVLTAPDGTLTADLWVENTATAGRAVTQTASFVAGTTYTASVFAKRGDGARRLGLLFVNVAFGININATFELSGDGSANVAVGPATATIQSVGNGWYRCSLTATATTTAVAQTQIRLTNLSTNADSTYTGDGTSGIYIWGAQLEAASQPSSYIKTEASQVTRAADSAVMTGSNFSSWYRQDEGVFAVTVRADNYAVTGAQIRTFARVEDASNPSTNSMRFGRGTTNAIRFQNNQDILLPSAAIAFGTITPGNDDTFAVAYSSEVPSLVLDGVLYGPITSGYTGMTAGKNRLALGGDGVGTATAQLNGHIKRLTYYPRRLSNDQLVALTT